MPIIGGRQASVRGLGFQGAGKPNAPTINSVTRASDTSVTITYTLGSNNGAPITTIGFTSSPSIALSFTNTDLDGSITVTGSFASNTAYTFTMKATNAVGTSDASSASSSVTPNPIYSLSQTFNASGTYTVPAGASEMALLIVGSGGGGGTNNNAKEFGAGGGSGGALLAVKDYPVTPGQTYSVTIGSGGNSQGSGGASSVGNLVTINGGNPGTLHPNTSRGLGGVPGNITSNINSYHVSNYGGATGGVGGTSLPYGGVVPNAGTSATAVSMNLTGLGSVSIGSNAGSGGGGAGFNHTNNSSARIGASGGTGGGSGGNGDLLDAVNEFINANANDGGSTTQKGAGGGGSGGVFYGGNAKVGGSAGPAQILVYAR